MRLKVVSALTMVAAIASVFVVAALGTAQERTGRGSVTGQVRLRGGDHPVVVYLEGVPGRVPASAREAKRIVQRDLAFSPELTVIVKGSSVEFPNNDHVFHNVFSLSRTKRFDLGLYRSGDSRTVRFSRPGIVDVYCNIHPEMVAKILVLPNVHYARVDGSGSFRISGVPAGTYRLVAWQMWGDAWEGDVTIEPGGTARQNIRLTAGRRRARHMRKDGTPYGRYR